jgi:hypothetical protein
LELIPGLLKSLKIPSLWPHQTFSADQYHGKESHGKQVWRQQKCVVFFLKCLDKALFFFQSPNFLTYKETKKRFQGINSARLCSLAGRYDNPIPIRFLVPLDCLKIPTQFLSSSWKRLSYFSFAALVRQDLSSGQSCIPANSFINS